jgi:hypothetical protein
VKFAPYFYVGTNFQGENFDLVAIAKIYIFGKD